MCSLRTASRCYGKLKAPDGAGNPPLDPGPTSSRTHGSQPGPTTICTHAPTCPAAQSTPHARARTSTYGEDATTCFTWSCTLSCRGGKGGHPLGHRVWKRRWQAGAPARGGRRAALWEVGAVWGVAPASRPGGHHATRYPSVGLAKPKTLAVQMKYVCSVYSRLSGECGGSQGVFE